MMRLIISFYAIPALLTIGASVVLMEQTSVILCAALAFAVTILLTSMLVGFCLRKQQLLWLVLVGAIISLTFITSIATFHWPLRAVFFLSRASLDRLAAKVDSGQQFVGPARIGLITIVEAEVNRHGIVCLWVDLNPTGKTGFVRCGPDHVPFNLWSKVNLDDRWQLIAED